MGTLATKSVSVNKLAASQSLIEDPTQLDRMATIRACPALVSWLEADTCFSATGANAGWRDRISGALLVPPAGQGYASVQSVSLFNSKPSLLFPTSPQASLNDNGAGLLPSGNTSFTHVVVGVGTSGQNNIFLSDNSLTASTTQIAMHSAGQVYFYIGGTLIYNTPGNLSFTAPHLFISGFKYVGSGSSSWSARIDRGAITPSASSLSVTCGASKLTVGAYNNGSLFSDGMQIAMIMVFNDDILAGSLSTSAYPNWSNEVLWQIIEDYVHNKYGI